MDSLYLYNKYGNPDFLRPVELSPPSDRLGLQALAGKGRCHLGGARRPARVRLLQDDVLGGGGSRVASGRPSALSPRIGTAGRRCATRCTKPSCSADGTQQRGAFVQQFDGDALDASTLLMPLVFFVSPTDPRMLRTIDAINRPPKDGGLVSDGLVFRYDVEKTPDGLKGTEGTFNLCTFWLVEALTRASPADAKTPATEPATCSSKCSGTPIIWACTRSRSGHQGQALGNFPQALTHLALISAAFNLDRYLDGLRENAARPVVTVTAARSHAYHTKTEQPFAGIRSNSQE